MTRPFHDPVMVTEVIDLLITVRDGTYVDCTIGGGGHSRQILARLTSQGKLIGIDRDEDALKEARERLGEQVTLLHVPFSNLASEVRRVTEEPVHGILMDLGVSSYQLDQADRGFSYRMSGPLDLRMDRSKGESAAQLLTELDLDGLTRILRDYGEDSQTRRIARAIYSERERQPIETTDQLASIIRKAVPATAHKSLPRVFQALRIAVNTEMAELEAGLTGAWEILRPGGRLAVISYHSLEDRRVKLFFTSKLSPKPEHALRLPVPAPPPAARAITRKPVTPSDSEIERNPRARSAKLRVVEKLPALASTL